MQFFFYLIVGGLSFFVDIGAFVAMRAIEVPVIPASISSFILATAANYLLSILLAFERGRFRRHMEMLRVRLGQVTIQAAQHCRGRGYHDRESLEPSSEVDSSHDPGAQRFRVPLDTG